MEPLKCRGAICDNTSRCEIFAKCTYKSSSQLMMEEAQAERECAEATASIVTPASERNPLRTPVVVKDFDGKIDGAGIKSVMREMKCPLELIPPQFTEGVAEVLKFGAKKYAANNWMRGMSWETVAGGIMRHVSAFRRGEEIDPESGLPHLDHASCGLMFLRTYAHGVDAERHHAFDDRLHKDTRQLALAL